MTPVIPFVPARQLPERDMWQAALASALGTFARITPFEELTPDERAAAKVAIVANPAPEDVAALPNLSWVQSLWAGVERLTADLPEEGPLIVRLTDPQLAETMAEAVLAWTLYLHRDMPRYRQQQDQKVWLEHSLKLPRERTIGVLGLGKLGEASARRLAANGFQVLGWSRSVKALDGLTCLHGPEGLTCLLQHSDIIVILLPLTDETKGLIGKAALQDCKPGAAVINFGRGPVLDSNALLEALDRGQLCHAVLDVFDEEPLPTQSPLWQHAQVTVLPHISAPTVPGTACRIVAQNIKTFLDNGTIPASVDRKRGY